jgi:GNAT superfamily N-acetyltransferase
MANTSNPNETGRLPPREKKEKIDPARIEFKRLSAECPRGAFSCGYVHIDHFFKNTSLDDHNCFRARTVTAHLDGAPEPIGFYAMTIGPETADQFEKEPSFLERIKAQFFRTQMLTTVQLIWVGVESEMQRRGIGRLLMGRALDDFYQIVDRTGIAALTLEPISANAGMFYRSLGFRPYGPGGKRMLLAAEAIMAIRSDT